MHHQNHVTTRPRSTPSASSAPRESLRAQPPDARRTDRHVHHRRQPAVPAARRRRRRRHLNFYDKINMPLPLVLSHRQWVIGRTALSHSIGPGSIPGPVHKSVIIHEEVRTVPLYHWNGLHPKGNSCQTTHRDWQAP